MLDACACRLPGRYAKICGAGTRCACSCHPTIVVNVSGGRACDVYVGRATSAHLATAEDGHDGYFGNDFQIGIDGTREDVVAMHEILFWLRVESDPEYREEVDALHGCSLGCFCAPERCHADVIAEYLNRKFQTQLPLFPKK